MVFRSKAIFQIQNIRFGLLRRLSICQERELSCFSWMRKNCLPGGTGADHQRFSATMLRQHSKTKAQSCSGDALLLCFNVAAGGCPADVRPRPPGSNTNTVAVLEEKRSVFHPDRDHADGFCIFLVFCFAGVEKLVY